MTHPFGRRAFLCSLAAWPVVKVLRAGSAPASLADKAEIHYRVDASVLFLGVTLLTRSNVGGGRASVERDFGPGGPSLTLFFGAGSWPEKAAGINRFGIMHERVDDHESPSPSIEFSGFVTSNKEESFEEARHALKNKDKGTTGVTAIRGAVQSGQAHSFVKHLLAPSGASWAKAEDLQAFLEGATRDTDGALRKEASTGSSLTFLAAMRNAGLHQGPSLNQPFLHNAEMYTLETRRSENYLDGTIRKGGKKSADFRTWYNEDGSGIPRRIEYRAKPYLKLTFDAVPPRA
jgi:hypothetical protein